MPERKKRKYLFAVVYSLVVAAFTAYVMLDTFVLERVEQVDATAQNTSMFDDIEVKKLNNGTADSTLSAAPSASDEQVHVHIYKLHHHISFHMRMHHHIKH